MHVIVHVQAHVHTLLVMLRISISHTHGWCEANDVQALVHTFCIVLTDIVCCKGGVECRAQNVWLPVTDSECSSSRYIQVDVQVHVHVSACVQVPPLTLIQHVQLKVLQYTSSKNHAINTWRYMYMYIIYMYAQEAYLLSIAVNNTLTPLTITTSEGISELNMLSRSLFIVTSLK